MHGTALTCAYRALAYELCFLILARTATGWQSEGDYNWYMAMAGLDTNFYFWWPDRATKIINFYFLVARK